MLTERTRVHEVPEGIIPVPAMAWSRNNSRKHGAGEVYQDLEEQGGHANDLRTELL